jgi:arsenite methyltransferase
MFWELVTRKRAARVPEPALIMDDPSNVDAYARAGTDFKVLAPVYVFNCAHICDVVKPGDTILDLGCGPATQLAMAAQLNPEAQFHGVDLSDGMLARGREYLAQLGVRNVTLSRADITTLHAFRDHTVDAVISTLTLHHLPDAGALKQTFREIARVLRPNGGVFLLDFGHLRSDRAIRRFAFQYADRQPEAFTTDYLNSLRAAWPVSDFKEAAETLRGRASLYQTFFSPYMVAIKSPALRSRDSDTSRRLRALVESLPTHHRADLRDLDRFFTLGGLRSALPGD